MVPTRSFVGTASPDIPRNPTISPRNLVSFLKLGSLSRVVRILLPQIEDSRSVIKTAPPIQASQPSPYVVYPISTVILTWFTIHFPVIATEMTHMIHVLQTDYADTTGPFNLAFWCVLLVELGLHGVSGTDNIRPLIFASRTLLIRVIWAQIVAAGMKRSLSGSLTAQVGQRITSGGGRLLFTFTRSKVYLGAPVTHGNGVRNEHARQTKLADK